MKDGEVLYKSKEGNTQSLNNPLEKVIVHKRSIPVTTEFEINYEMWAGHLKVLLHVYVSKFGLLITDKNPTFEHETHEIKLTWEQLEEMKEELFS